MDFRGSAFPSADNRARHLPYHRPFVGNIRISDTTLHLGHDKHTVGVALADRRGKPAADHIAQNVKENHVRCFPGDEIQLRQNIEGRDNAPSGAAEPRSRAAGLDAEHPAKPQALVCGEASRRVWDALCDETDVTEADFLSR